MLSTFEVSSTPWLADSTRRQFVDVNSRIDTINASLAEVEAAARQARASDPMCADPDDVFSAFNALAKARIDALRDEIRVRQELPPLFAAIGRDTRHAIEAADHDLAAARADVREKLAALGFAEFLAVKDSFGKPVSDQLVDSNSSVTPLIDRLSLLRRHTGDTTAWEISNRQALIDAKAGLQRLFSAADPDRGSRPRVSQNEDFVGSIH